MILLLILIKQLPLIGVRLSVNLRANIKTNVVKRLECNTFNMHIVEAWRTWLKYCIHG